MMISIHTHFLKVIVLTAYTKAFLSIRRPFVRGLFITQEIILELIHPRVGEHQGRVVFHHNRGRRDNFMSFGTEKVQESLTYICAGHHTTV
jgi:hypothetical protein